MRKTTYVCDGIDCKKEFETSNMVNRVKVPVKMGAGYQTYTHELEFDLCHDCFEKVRSVVGLNKKEAG